jgi:murein DD-endopeptidase MepM/ murein hydrolase activator NlpD
MQLYFPFKLGTFNAGWNTTGSDFGERESPITGKIVQHGGIDVGAVPGTPVLSAAQGIVRKLVYDHSSAGTYLHIEHPNGQWTRYLHLREPLVEVGEEVKAGQKVGLSGGVPGEYGAGNTTSPHLHFELWRGQPFSSTGERLNPLEYLNPPGTGRGIGVVGWTVISAGLAVSIIGLGWYLRRGFEGEQ